MLQRGSGTTQSERTLVRLAERSFLRLWTYPNLYRDQGNGKEVCDLVVVFDDHIILFSDKQIAFPPGELRVAWQRWKRRAVLASVDQLVGAKRWLSSHPDRLYLDPKCEQRFPLPIDPKSAKFHLVSVAVGAAEACKRELGGTGSLVASDRSDLRDQPFVVQTLYGEEVVQVLDEVTLPLVLGHLDTVPDLLNYFAEREVLCRSARLGMSSGEENLLAAYLSSGLIGKASLLPEHPGTIVFGEDLWTGFTGEPEYKAYRQFLAPAYAWDRMIEVFNDFVIAGTMAMGNELGIAGHESRLRALARTTRLERRQLSIAFAGLFQVATHTTALFRCIRLPSRPDTVFAFVVVPQRGVPLETYRADRAGAVTGYCLSIKASHPDVLHVVGVATSPTDHRMHSEDVVHVDATQWTAELQTMAERVKAESGFYTAPTAGEVVGAAPAPFTILDQRRVKNAQKRARRARRRAP